MNPAPPVMRIRSGITPPIWHRRLLLAGAPSSSTAFRSRRRPNMRGADLTVAEELTRRGAPQPAQGAGAGALATEPWGLGSGRAEAPKPFSDELLAGARSVTAKTPAKAATGG